MKPRILLVDDEPSIVKMLAARLQANGYDIVSAEDGLKGLEVVKKERPDLIILDVVMPQLNGMQMKSELNKGEITASIPVIFLSAKASTENKVEGLRLWADDYVTKPFDAEELLARVDSVLSRRKYYEEVSMKDALTGLPNANFFRKQLAITFDMARRYGRIFSLGFIDIDHFKEINDTFGHVAGDSVLREIGKRMQSVMRKSDIFARYGGDEFGIILQEATEEQSNIALARLKNVVEEKPYTRPDGGEKILISISAGLATYDSNFSSELKLFESADKNMYQDKQKKIKYSY